MIAAALMASCAQPQPPQSELAAINERLDRLEQRVAALDRWLTSLPSPPLRSRAEIVANIQALELRRAELLQRYTPAHPDVREVDLSLRLLRLQLDLLDQAKRASQ